MSKDSSVDVLEIHLHSEVPHRRLPLSAAAANCFNSDPLTPGQRRQTVAGATSRNLSGFGLKRCGRGELGICVKVSEGRRGFHLAGGVLERDNDSWLAAPGLRLQRSLVPVTQETESRPGGGLFILFHFIFFFYC